MKNDFAIKRQVQDAGKLYVFIETDKTVFRGMSWKKLGEWGKRKCENFMILSRWHDKKEYVKIIYV